MEQQKQTEKLFSVRLDPELRKQIKFTAYKNDMTVKDAMTRLIQLFVEAGSVELLERLYRERE